MKEIYFDNAATTVVSESVIETMNRVMREDYGNPSSSHECGRRAAAVLENARNTIAAALGISLENNHGTTRGRLCFTSGGTEANNLAILGVAHTLRHKLKYKPDFSSAANSIIANNTKANSTSKVHLITSATEHDSVKAPFKKLENEGFDVTYLMPDASGSISAESFAEALREDTMLSSVMLVNNETGAVNPISDYAAEIKRRGLPTLLHTDAVQGFCKIPFSVKSLGADLITVSAHKLHGPKGAGALYIGENIKLSALGHGGGQESGLRSGTEPMPNIAGFAEAVSSELPHIETAAVAVRDLRNYTIDLLKANIPGAVIIGCNIPAGDYKSSPGNASIITSGSPYILCFSLPGFKSEVLLTYLSSEGIYVSKGSACKKGARSPTLEAMKLPVKVIDSALRVSFSRHNTRGEAERFVNVLKTAVETLVR